jgi:hypothetical protein
MTTQPALAPNNPCLSASAFVGLLLETFEGHWAGTLLMLDEHEQFVAAIHFHDGLARSGRFRETPASLQEGMLPLFGQLEGSIMLVASTDLVGEGAGVVRGLVHTPPLVLSASRFVAPRESVESVLGTIGRDWLKLNPAVEVDAFGLEADERTVIECLRGAPCDLEQLAIRTQLAEPALRRIVYAFWITRALTLMPAWRPRASGIAKRAKRRERFDSEPTLVVQFDPTAESLPMRPTAPELDSADTHLIVAELLLERGDPRAAVLQAQKALRLGRLRPNQEALYAWLLYQRSGAGAYVPPCVWQHLASALERDPECDRAHYYQGMLHKRRGEFALARKHLARALELNPDHAEAECELLLLRSARAARPSPR